MMSGGDRWSRIPTAICVSYLKALLGRFRGGYSKKGRDASEERNRDEAKPAVSPPWKSPGHHSERSSVLAITIGLASRIIIAVVAGQLAVLSMLTLINLQWIGFNWPTWTLVALCVIAYYWTWCNSRFARLIDAIPGPRGLPVLGSILDLNVDQVGKLSIPRPAPLVRYQSI